MDKSKSKFGIKVNKQLPGAWSFGICLTHWERETYIYINFWMWAVSIGKMTE